jgi:chemotaxis protein MotB
VKTLAIAGAVVVAALLTGCANTKAMNAEIASLRDDVAQLEMERNSLQDQVGQLQQQNAALGQQMGSMQQKAAQYDELQRKLGPDIDVVTRDGLVTMQVADKVLYRSGQATLTAQGKATLRRVASALKSEFAGKMVRVEGHTDSDPINKTKDLYKDNWDLAYARAAGVVRYLTTEGGVDPKRIYAASYGQYDPVASNSTTQGKAQNRRVAVVVLPMPAR